MRAVVQRVSQSKVIVDDTIVGAIDFGLNVLLGVEKGDTQADVEYLANKISNLRIFEDDDDKLNLSLKDVNGKMIVVSQFTLLGDCRKGRRPSFIEAARPNEANERYEQFVSLVQDEGIEVETGQFQEHMTVEIINDGPVTLILDSKKNF
jgi:D-tyrosyl-tRNA(Tyr) deacylase